ncbi:2Fe-2S iron-sulfur cluster-binding protein [Sphingomonas sp. MG17]|uniref:2Fe-2S iron-sulfur cluster-binding protein n=1 Tax=Sphingomonas tagetis TaxID=2949092 RepID=A0A9X2HFU4_9SPHN|nr:2Fe-2S iron-sulfur cluster-binding protein [Sphingomonas tagetis]MCP3730013.1 2Fe-2S iron-sulfur cluster-binding protein [Sphingomonas tagetis]
MKYQVTLSGSGHRFECGEKQNILAAGLEAGFMLPYNCRSGFCRTCKSKVVEGAISYADQPMTHYLTVAEHEAGYALLCQANPRSDLLIETDEIIGAENIRPHQTPCRIVAMDRAADDVMILKLRLPQNENVRYFPGQHLAFDLGEGVKREYSIANVCKPEGVTELELHIRHTPGGVFTDRLFNEMALKALLRLEMPLGTFFLRSDSDRPVMLLATGTGFAPIKAMVEHAIATGEIGQRSFTLYWGGRREEDLYMAGLAREWAGQYPGFTFHPVLSRAPDGEWQGRTGHVQDQLIADHPDLSGADVYACGSPAMIEDTARRFEAMGGQGPAHFYADEFLTAAERAARTQEAFEEDRA